MSHVIGHVNKVAINANVLNRLNSASWLIDLELITYWVTFRQSKCKNAMYVCVDKYLTMKKIIKRVYTLHEPKIGYSL